MKVHVMAADGVVGVDGSQAWIMDLRMRDAHNGRVFHSEMPGYSAKRPNKSLTVSWKPVNERRRADRFNSTIESFKLTRRPTFQTGHPNLFRWLGDFPSTRNQWVNHRLKFKFNQRESIWSIWIEKITVNTQCQVNNRWIARKHSTRDLIPQLSCGRVVLSPRSPATHPSGKIYGRTRKRPTSIDVHDHTSLTPPLTIHFERHK